MKNYKITLLLLLLLLPWPYYGLAVLLDMSKDLRIKAALLSTVVSIIGVIIWAAYTCYIFYSNPENKGK